MKFVKKASIQFVSRQEGVDPNKNREVVLNSQFFLWNFCNVNGNPDHIAKPNHFNVRTIAGFANGTRSLFGWQWLKVYMGFKKTGCFCRDSIFILQSLTTSKMRKFQTLKLSQFHKEKTCWTENWWSSGIMSNFWG